MKPTQHSTPTHGPTVPGEELPPLERLMMDDIRDLRDRMARAEQDTKNQKENFQAFKQDDFQSLKGEVHTMRGELNAKIDELLEKVGSINLTMAKWMGAGAVILFLGELALKKFLG